MGLIFSAELDLGTYIASIAKSVSKKIGALMQSMNFFLLGLLCISINLPYGLAWNAAVTSGLVLLAATWNCWISYKNGYVGLLAPQ